MLRNPVAKADPSETSTVISAQRFAADPSILPFHPGKGKLILRFRKSGKRSGPNLMVGNEASGGLLPSCLSVRLASV